MSSARTRVSSLRQSYPRVNATGCRRRNRVFGRPFRSPPRFQAVSQQIRTGGATGWNSAGCDWNSVTSGSLPQPFSPDEGHQSGPAGRVPEISLAQRRDQATLLDSDADQEGGDHDNDRAEHARPVPHHDGAAGERQQQS